MTLHHAQQLKLGAEPLPLWDTTHSTFSAKKEGETGIILINGKAIVTPGEGDNKIDVSIDQQTGEQIVTIDGAAYRIPAGHQLTIRAGSGNDIHFGTQRCNSRRERRWRNRRRIV